MCTRTSDKHRRCIGTIAERRSTASARHAVGAVTDRHSGAPPAPAGPFRRTGNGPATLHTTLPTRPDHTCTRFPIIITVSGKNR